MSKKSKPVDKRRGLEAEGGRKVPQKKEVARTKGAKVVPRSAVKKKRPKTSWGKEIILGLVSLIFVVILVILLGKLPQRASELNSLRGANLRAETKSRIEISELEIESGRKKADKLSALFPDESGLVEFVKQIEKFKEEGVVTDFSFTSQRAVRDRTGFFGVPAVIGLSGSWSQIDSDLQKLHNLPFLFRAIVVETEQLDADVVDLKYGVFIYVDESLGQN